MIEINDILKELSYERPIFHSEKDFQFALAWKIKEKHPDIKIRLEKRVEIGTKGIYIDLYLEKEKQIIPIELKYKTVELEKNYNGEKFILKDQNARDQGRYDFIKDITRIERLLQEYSYNYGYVIFLTNDALYWKKGRENTCDWQFKIHDGIEPLHGKLNWKEGTSKGTKSGREETLEIKGTYPIEWVDYWDFKITNGKFRYLIIKIVSP